MVYDLISKDAQFPYLSVSRSTLSKTSLTSGNDDFVLPVTLLLLPNSFLPAVTNIDSNFSNSFLISYEF